MKYLFTGLAILICGLAYSQPNFGFTEATIVFKRGDSMLCLIKREVHFGDVVTYKIHQNGEESHVGSTYIKSIRIGSRHIESIPIDKKGRLATLIHTGKLILYNYVETETGEAVRIPDSRGMVARIITTVHYIVKRGNNYIEIKEKSFEKDLKNLLSDCPTIISKLDSHDFAFSDISTIIEQYNSCNN